MFIKSSVLDYISLYYCKYETENEIPDTAFLWGQETLYITCRDSLKNGIANGKEACIYLNPF